MSLNSTLSSIWNRFQAELFPALAEEFCPLLENHKPPRPSPRLGRGRALRRYKLARPRTAAAESSGPGAACIAKAKWDLPTTQDLNDRLMVDAPLRRLCGWSRVSAIPSEGDVFAGVCRVFRGPPCGAHARSPGEGGPGGGTDRPCLAGLDGDRGGGRSWHRNRQPGRSRSAGAVVPARARK